MPDDKDARIAWSDAPETDRRPFYPIWSPTPDRDVSAVITSQDVIGVWTHWYEGRTHPCRGSRRRCEGCGLGYRRQWKGYLAGHDFNRGRSGLIEVTQEAFLRTPGLTLRKGKLRGCVIRLRRAGASRQARVVAALTEWTGDRAALPPAFDVVAALERIWGIGRPTALYMSDDGQADEEEGNGDGGP